MHVEYVDKPVLIACCDIHKENPVGVIGVAKIMHVLGCISIEIYTIGTFSFNMSSLKRKWCLFVRNMHGPALFF